MHTHIHIDNASSSQIYKESVEWIHVVYLYDHRMMTYFDYF